jgi:hypothetical protein
MIKRLISLSLFGLTVGTLWSLNRQLRQGAGASASTSAAPAAPVHTWEGEGGALPATGAQMGPDPATSARPRVEANSEDEGAVH